MKTAKDYLQEANSSSSSSSLLGLISKILSFDKHPEGQ